MHTYVPATNAHAEELKNSPYRTADEKQALQCWRVREDDYRGQPLNFPACQWCGSMTPQLFVELLQKGATCDVADWKYGYPHKIYVETANPNPDELRSCGSTSVGSEQRYNERGVMTHRVKTQEQAPEGFPEWGDKEGWHYKSKFPNLHLKFYTAHLADLPELAEHQELIRSKTGIRFFRNDEGAMMYQVYRNAGGQPA